MRAPKALVIPFKFREGYPDEIVDPLIEQSVALIKEAGVEAVVTEEFTQEYKNTECEEFVSEYIAKRLNAKAVFVGFNYRFGKNAKGNAESLKKLCESHKIETFVSKCIEVDGVSVSSSEIRKLIENGETESVKRFMGRYFSLCGEVVKGRQLGRTLGFPTANTEFPDDTIIPPCGVYISRTKVGDNKYYSITNVGEKPTVYDERKNIETAIGDFSRDIYGEKIEIEFIKKIRNIEKFHTLFELTNQLERDMEKSKEYFERMNRNE